MSSNVKRPSGQLTRFSFFGLLSFGGYILKAARYHQWVKNLFIFIPAFFAGTILNANQFSSLLIAFLAFSLGASTIYIVNDLADIEKDRLHPKKKFRPIAAGLISPTAAKIIALITLMASALLCLFLPNQFALVLICYILLNLAYSWSLKHIAFLDIVIIALGFFLRVFAGGIVAGVVISSWLVLIVFQLALFLAFAKRRDDFLIFKREGTLTRKSISGYNLVFIDSSAVVLVALTAICYIMYTVSPDVVARLESPYVYLTSFPVIIGVLRYLQITFVLELSGSPTEVVLKDKFLQSVILIWLGMFFFFLYL